MISKEVNQITLEEMNNLFIATKIIFKCGHGFLFSPSLSEKGLGIDVVRLQKDFCETCDNEILQLIKEIESNIKKNLEVESNG